MLERKGEVGCKNGASDGHGRPNSQQKFSNKFINAPKYNEEGCMTLGHKV